MKNISKRTFLMMLVIMMFINFTTVSLASIRGHWAEDNIRHLLQSNVIHGDNYGNINPENTITRAELVKTINGVFNFNREGQLNFKDVNKRDWFYKEISIAVGHGYINGYNDETMKPNKKVTREEAAVMIGKALSENSKPTAGIRFTDYNSISSWATTYVDNVSGLGYINGYPDGRFVPKGQLKRAEAFTIVAKITQSDNLEEEVYRLVNVERSKAGVKPLTLSTEISKVARDKSKDMAENKYFNHTSPTWGSPYDMMRAYGINFNFGGENIASGYHTAESVLRGWMESTSHKRNILNTDYNKIGIGYYELNGDTYWTQMFTD